MKEEVLFLVDQMDGLISEIERMHLLSKQQGEENVSKETQQEMINTITSLRKIQLSMENWKIKEADGKYDFSNVLEVTKKDLASPKAMSISSSHLAKWRETITKKRLEQRNRMKPIYSMEKSGKVLPSQTASPIRTSNQENRHVLFKKDSIKRRAFSLNPSFYQLYYQSQKRKERLFLMSPKDFFILDPSSSPSQMLGRSFLKA